MECNVCLNEWDSDKTVPKMLPCGHSFCQDCLHLFFKKSNQSIACPTCLVVHDVKGAANAGELFQKNFALIALAEQSKATRGARLLQMKMSLVNAGDKQSKRKRRASNEWRAKKVPSFSIMGAGGASQGLNSERNRNRFFSSDNQ